MSNFSLGRRGSLRGGDAFLEDTTGVSPNRAGSIPSMTVSALSGGSALGGGGGGGSYGPPPISDGSATPIETHRSLLENANASVLVTPMSISCMLPFVPFYSFRRSQPFVPRVAWKTAVHGIKALRRLKLLQPGASGLKKAETSSSTTTTPGPSRPVSQLANNNAALSRSNSLSGSSMQLQADMIVISGHEDGHLLVSNAEAFNSLNHAQMHNHVTINHLVVCNTLLYTTCERHGTTGKAGDDDHVTVWDLNTMQVLHTYSAHEDRVTALAVSEIDETKSFSGGVDRVIYAWDSHRPEAPIGKFVGHNASITQLVTIKEGLVSASGDGQLRLWNTSTYASMSVSIAIAAEEAKKAKQEREQHTIVFGSNLPANLESVEGGSLVDEPSLTASASSSSQPEQQQIKDLSFVDAHSGQIERCIWLVTPAEAEREVAAYDKKQRQAQIDQRLAMRHHQGGSSSSNSGSSALRPGSSPATTTSSSSSSAAALSSSSFMSPQRPSPHGQLVTGCSGGSIRCWSVNLSRGTFALAWSQRAHKGLVTDIAIDTKHSIVASTSASEGVVCLFNYRTQQTMKVPVIPHGALRRVSLDPNRCSFLCGADDGSLCVWSYEGFARETSSSAGGQAAPSTSSSSSSTGGGGGGGSTTAPIAAVSPVGMMHPHLSSISSMLLEVTPSGSWERLITCAKDNSVFVLDFDTKRGSHTVPFGVAPTGMMSRQGVVVVRGRSYAAAGGGDEQHHDAGAEEEEDDDEAEDLTPAEEFYRRLERERKRTEKLIQQQQQQQQNQQHQHKKTMIRRDQMTMQKTIAPSSIFLCCDVPKNSKRSAFVFGDSVGSNTNTSMSGADGSTAIRLYDSETMREKKTPTGSFSTEESGSNSSAALGSASSPALASAPVNCIHRLVLSAASGGTATATPLVAAGKEDATVTLFRPFPVAGSAEPRYELDFSQETAGPVRCFGSYSKKKQHPGGVTGRAKLLPPPPDLVMHLLAVGTQRASASWAARAAATEARRSSDHLEKQGAIQLMDVRSMQFLGHPIALPSFPERLDVFFAPSSSSSSSSQQRGGDDANSSSSSKKISAATAAGASSLPSGTIFVVCYLRSGGVYSVELDLSTLIAQQHGLGGGDNTNNSAEDTINDASLMNTTSDLNFSTAGGAGGAAGSGQKPFAIRQLAQAAAPKFFTPASAGADLASQIADYSERHPSGFSAASEPPRCVAFASISLDFEPPRFTVHFADKRRLLLSHELILTRTGHHGGAASVGGSSRPNSPLTAVTETVAVANSSLLDAGADILDVAFIGAGGFAFAVALSDGNVLFLKWESLGGAGHHQPGSGDTSPSSSSSGAQDQNKNNTPNRTGLKIAATVRRYGSVDTALDDSEAGGAASKAAVRSSHAAAVAKSRSFFAGSEMGGGGGGGGGGAAAFGSHLGVDPHQRALGESARCLDYDRHSRCLAIGYGDGTLQIVDVSAKRVACRRIVSNVAAVVQVQIVADNRVMSVTASGDVRFDTIHAKHLGV